MSDKRIHGKSHYRKYDAMTTEELEEILRADGSCTEEKESDTEVLLYIMEVLAQRKHSSVAKNKVQEAWGSFCEDYLPNEEIEPSIEKNSVKLRRPNLRRIITLAAAIILVAGLAISASAVDWSNVWGVVAKWNADRFYLLDEDETVPTDPQVNAPEDYRDFYQMITVETGMEDLVPTKIPEGFRLDEIKVEELPNWVLYTAKYSSADRSFKICVELRVEGNTGYTEKDGGAVEVYQHGDTNYYIFTNNEKRTAAWYNSPYECFIFGGLTKDEMKALIDTIP